MSETAVNSPPSPGGRLLSALTTDQIEILLSAVVAAGVLPTLDERLRTADPDLADTVRRLLVPAPTAPTAAALRPSDLSDQKALEEWHALWSTWQRCVDELGDAEGDYANHEEHWHPPWFDSGELSRDLESAARPMLDLLDRAFPLVRDPDLFLDGLREIAEGIESFPEWMQPFDDRFDLGPVATTCLLRWTWLGLADQPSPGPALVDAIHSLRETVEEVDLDTGACVRFFSELPDADVRDVLVHLRQGTFDDAMADVRSVWHRARHACEQRVDPGAHLRTCAEHLASNWTYGEPLIADALQRGDLADAEKSVEATLSSLLGADPEEPWRPELGLVPEHRYYRPGDGEAAILRLLEQWEAIAAQRGRAKRAAACRLQRALLDHPHDWPAVLEDFAAYREAAAAPAVAEELFGQWRDRAVAVCTPPRDISGADQDVAWVRLLIEARRDPATQRDRFVEHVRAWLDSCQASAASFGTHWRSLALVTRTLPPAEKLKDQFPAFWEHVLLPVSGLEPKLLASLAEALAFLGDATVGLDPLPVWREHLHELVPSPAGSSYDGPARWMKALSELVPDRYASVLARWTTEFKRRRNLWAEMRSIACPGL